MVFQSFHEDFTTLTANREGVPVLFPKTGSLLLSNKDQFDNCAQYRRGSVDLLETEFSVAIFVFLL